MKHSDNAKYCVIVFGQDVNMNCISCKLVLAALNVAACAVHHYRRIRLSFIAIKNIYLFLTFSYMTVKLLMSVCC